jgi:uncharacterized protein (DUF362 family)
MTVVSVVKGENPVDLTCRAMDRVRAETAFDDSKPILVKPNYINSRHPSTGITTDRRVIEGVIKFLKKHGFEDIIIGEGSGTSDTFEAFRVAGVDSIARKWNVRMVDLNKDEFKIVSPTEPLSLERVKVARTALECNIISVPKLKLHRTTGVTLSIKNMMGAMVPKGSMHSRNLSKNIADLASVIKPRLAVIDGIVAGEGHETSGNPVEMNLIIAGSDPVAVDTVGAKVMGVSPGEAKHLVYSEQKGLGTSDLESIEILGESLEKVAKDFRRF